MKTIKKALKYMVLAILLMVSLSASAYDFTVGGIYYNILPYTNLKCEVTYGGEDENRALYSGKVTIPSTVVYNRRTYTVTSIGEGAFSRCTSLTSVEIPNSVTSIGNGAFSNCTSLTSVVIPNSVTSIGRSAFSGCTSLTSVDIPNSVTSIVWYAFSNCTSLTSVVIPNSVTSIGQYAFEHCTSLKSVDLGDGVTSISNHAFYECTSLTSVVIPNSVTSIDWYTFEECSSLVAIIVEDGNKNYSSSNGLLLTADKEKLILAPKGISYVDIPSSVKSIGTLAFSYCKRLTSVDIPNSVTSIGGSAFNFCESLTSVEIPNSVTSIGNGAFSNCTSLTSVVIPNSVKSIGTLAFSYCKRLTSVDIPSSVTSIGDRAFYCCDSLTSMSIGNGVTSIGKYAFDYCTSLTSLKIGNSVTSIGGLAFNDCPSLTNIEVGNAYVLEKMLGYAKTLIVADDYSDTSFPSLTYSYYTKLDTIVCNLTTPPTLPATFSNSQYLDLVVIVPKEAFVTYQAADVWKDFRCLWKDINMPQIIEWEQTFEDVKVGNFITLTASATSGLDVEYVITQGSEYAEISYGYLVCNAAGDITIEARQAGNGKYKAAESISKTLSIVKYSQDISWYQTFKDVKCGDEIVLSAYSLSSCLDVEFVITQGSEYAEIAGDTLICKAVGEVTIEARQAGNYKFEAAESVSKTISISKRQQTMTWEQTFEKVKVGDEIALTATASSGLAVEYAITKGSEYAEISDGKLVCKAAGDVTIEARQSGNDEYEAAESVSKTIHIQEAVVEKKQQNITWNQSFEDAKVGDEITLTATASSDLAVEYAITHGSEYAEISDGKLICKAAGNVTIEARQSGNDEYEAAESISKTIQVNETVITFPVTINGLTYDYCDDNENELKVTRCTAEVANVRAEINGMPVTTLSQTFRNTAIVKEVYLPASIVNLGFIPFEKNYNLTKITVAENNPTLCDIDGVLYSKDKSTLLYYPAGKGATYSVPEGTTAMSDHAFSGDEQLTSIVLPEGFASIGDDAFQSCIGLTSFTFPSTINKLGYGAIRECKNIMEIHSGILSPESVNMRANVFENIDKDKCTLYVPKGTKSLYEAVDQWKDFKNIIEENVNGIGSMSINGISIAVNNRTFMIKNAPANSNIRIYTVTGRLVYAGNETEIAMPTVGVYIVMVNGLSHKIVVK